MTEPFAVGQRWASEPEPELGLGIVSAVSFRDVEISFGAAGELRKYRKENAPLHRVRFRPGDKIQDKSKRSFIIESVADEDSLLVYHCSGGMVREKNLMDLMTFNQPEDRLFSGQLGRVKDFELRYTTLQLRHQALSSPCRGLVGARVELMEHQLHAAQEITSYSSPKALLADEVGLGKTIEAGLVFHKLFVTGAISRVLILVPHPLMNQWLVELYRRFNHLFTVIDEENFSSLCRSRRDGNPFLSSQTVICAHDFLTSSGEGLTLACQAGWDLLIVDEAHHLDWREGKASAEYRAAEAVSKSSSGLLLLTATPVSLGEESHFGRLRLLDPSRFQKYRDYLAEASRFQLIAGLADSIMEKKSLDGKTLDTLKKQFPKDTDLLANAEAAAAGGPELAEQLIPELLDRHGTGRMVFRNRRSVIKGFPGRELVPVKLCMTSDYRDNYERLLPLLQWNGRKAYFDPFLLTPSQIDLDQKGAARLLKKLWLTDPRIVWLTELIGRLSQDEKVLIICSSLAKVLALQEIFPAVTGARFTVFHENLPLNLRDKNAAMFSQSEEIRLMICSEIGSEGRNFQFARRLVLFDLPPGPGLLEQRIGRLHRIGQKHDVLIYALYVLNTPLEILFNWYHRGLDAFLSPAMGNDYVHRNMEAKIENLAQTAMEKNGPPAGWNQSMDRLTQEGKNHAGEIAEEIESGRDRLLELNADQASRARVLMRGIRREESSSSLEEYMEAVCDAYGVDCHATVEKRGYSVFPGPEMVLDSFPGLPESGLNVTFDREQALIREDLAFMSWDHPFIAGAADLVLGNTRNSACIAEWNTAPEKGLLLDLIFVLEPVLISENNVSPFLPPTPLRIILDMEGHHRKDLENAMEDAYLKQGPQAWLKEQREFRLRVFPSLLREGRRMAEMKVMRIRKAATENVYSSLQSEYERYRALSRVEEASAGPARVKSMAIKEQMEKAVKYIQTAEVRMDALRFILMTQSP